MYTIELKIENHIIKDNNFFGILWILRQLQEDKEEIDNINF